MTDYSAFRSALDRLDRETAAAEIRRARRDGWSVAEVIEQLIGPSQIWIGQEWEVGNATVAKEHAVTAINHQLLGLLDTSGEPGGEPIIVACAEGEWHSLACAMVTTVLRDLGYATTSMGGPLPAGQLLSLIHGIGPRCVVVSCVMEANLPGVRRIASVVREAGVPALVGGGALDEGRAVTAGGDGYVESVSSLGASIDRAPLVTHPVPPLEHDRAAGFEWLEAKFSRVAADVSAARSATGPRAEDALWLIRSLHASLMCDEPAILARHLRWMRRRAGVAGASDPDEIMAHMKRVLADAPPAVDETLRTASTD